MKTMRVLVLVLLASVHVFTPVSSDDSNPETPREKNILSTVASPAQITQTAEKQPSQPTAAATAAGAAIAQTPAATAPVKQTEVKSAAPATVKTAATPPASSDQQPQPTATANLNLDAFSNDMVDANSSMAGQDNVTVLQPRSRLQPDEGNQTDDQKKILPGPDDTLRPTSPSKDNSSHTSTVSPHVILMTTRAAELGKGKGTVKTAGPQTDTEEKATPKTGSDKRLWLILLPVLLVAAAFAIILRFKYKKVHDHTETIDTGTENASFQSRPESTKDGVMLLGVKSSGGEENAAAR